MDIWKKKKRLYGMSRREDIAVEVLNGGNSEQETKVQSPAKAIPPPSETRTCLNVAMFAILGCLTRVGLDTLMGGKVAKIENGETVIFVSFFSNMLGCFILGLLAASSLKQIPGMASVYTGISTGLCGSITTYSKWNQQISVLMIGEADPVGQDQIVALAGIAVGMTTSIASFEFGKDVSTGIRKRLNRSSSGDRGESPAKSSSMSRCCNIFNPILLLASWITLLVLAIVYYDHQTVFVVCMCGVFAPFGALTRYKLATFNSNPPNFISSSRMFKLFPFGTFLANFSGSIFIALTHVALTWSSPSCPTVGIVRAIQSGFLACLTTVSTFMSEVSNLRGKGQIRAAHIYATTTFVLCQAVAAIINGSSYSIFVNSNQAPSNVTCV